jgi:hypothetical protein
MGVEVIQLLQGCYGLGGVTQGIPPSPEAGATDLGLVYASLSGSGNRGSGHRRNGGDGKLTESHSGI